MGMSFWNYSPEELMQMLKDEASIHALAKKAYLIEDYTDVPSFNYLFYRNDDKSEMLLALKAIAANQRTSMMSLDNFFYAYKKLRRKGKCSLNFPTLSFPHLCIE
jgi:ssRNA-specific RNase YbeY (16S rRNA maturation enzyme)